MPNRDLRCDALAMLAAALFPSFAAWLYFVAMSDFPPALQQTAYVLGKVLQFGLPVVWVFLVRQERPHLARPRAPGVIAGVLFGTVVFAAMLAGYYTWLRPGGYLAVAVKPIAEKVSGFGVHGPGGYLVLGLFYCLVHSLLEEYYWRWFLFGGLRRHISPGAAALVSSLAFAAHHVIVLAVYFGWASWKTVVFSACVATGGAAWAWIYHRSNSLLGPWLSHLLVDGAIFLVGYDLVRNAAGW